MADDSTRPYHNTDGEQPRDPLGLIGWVISGKYKVLKYLGGGGFSEVYEGFNVNLPEQRLAIKFFKRMAAREKFAKEAKILCLLDHTNICRVIDYLPDEGAMVVQFIDGQDCGRILATSGALSEKLLLNVARSLSSAMSYAHNKKIAHRDIKPGNIIIDKNEHVYLIDFGIAKELREDATKTGYQALTPMFAAPERQKGDTQYNPYLSDIYEIGAAVFNLATNDVPYRNPVIPNTREWGGEAAKRLSPQLTRILRKATQPDPELRYQSASELFEDFHNLEYAYGRSHLARNIAIAAATVAAVVLVYVGVSQFAGSSHEQAATPALVDNSSQIAKPKTEATRPTPTVNPVVNKVQDQRDSSQAEQKKPALPKSEAVTVVERKDTVTTPPATSQSVGEPEVPKQPVTKSAQPESMTPVVTSVKATVQVSPSDDVALAVDGNSQQSNLPFTVAPGTHSIVVTQPDYPVYRGSIVVKDTSVKVQVDLAKQYSGTEPSELQVALSPYSDKHMMELTLNGKRQTITRFPVFGLQRLAGEWQIAVKIVAIDPSAAGTIRVDSCVTFPYGGGPRSSVIGSQGTIRLGTPGDRKGSTVPLVIFWTQR
jgi:serine/threonine protein kinase